MMPGVSDDPRAGDDSSESPSEASDHDPTSLCVSQPGEPLSPSASGSSSDSQSPRKGATKEQEVMNSRAYQLEMLEKSLERNAIVAMDTGSGKTQVALLRIRAELERCPSEKMVWFLAPTVLLCSQQFDVIGRNMPSIPARLLTGASNVDTWSESVWAPVLKGTRIVVSTPKVLDDALHHGFVRMNTLALLVFDEAHNCVGKAAESKIMMDYYHPRKRSGDDVPSILGLTASPSMRSKTEDMEKLEMILDSRCISPTLHRQELLKCVKKPRIYRVDYTLPSFPTYTTAIQSLRDVYDSLDIRDDPAVLHLVADLTERKRRLLVKMIEQHDTYTQNQIKGLYSRSLGISRQLGTWAADQYLWRAITEHLGRVDAEDEILDKWASEEKRYLGAALRKVGVVAPPADPTDVSDKVRLLIQELLASTQESPVCIVFAQERATVSALYELLTACTDITEKFRIGIVMGSSSYQGRKRNIYDLSRNTDVDLSVLQKFRSGHINLLLATSVLEEGIDVPACNLVICFDELQSFKAFIQRRGRARQRESRLVLFFERSNRITDQWEAMEREMKRQYEDEDRLRQDIEVLEHEEQSQNVFEVESTGAKIGLDEAKQHLEHFCRTLSHGEFVDARPDYILYRDWSASGMAVSATVILPPFLPKEVRQAESRSSWKSESNATKDAAFQAYMALYHAGLVNDNLLPFKPDQLPGIETRAPIADVESSFNPWKDVAQAWNAGGPRWVYTFTYYDERNTAMGEYDITLPVYLDQPRPIRIFRDYEIFWELRSSTGRKISSSEAEEMPDNTSTLLSLHFGHRWPVYEKGHVIRVTSKDAMLSREHIGSQPLESGMEGAKNQQYLVRDHLGTPYLYQDLLTSKPAPELVRNYPPDYEVAPEDVPYVVLKKWTKRADFLHRLLSGPGQTASSKPYGWVLPLPWAKVDTVPLDHAQFGMLLPSIIHELEVMLVTKDLADTLLSPLGISNLGLVRQAISAGSACEPFNYERLELLGDSILKYCAAILAASAHPKWPEGYLSFFKDRLISNSRLSRASIESGLAKYILTKPFTGHKWRPLYLEDILGQDPESSKDRKLSTKTLADVVEALIGAAYQDGGLSKACKCISLFIHEQSWPDMDECRKTLYSLQPETSTLPSTLAPLEEILGYRFIKKSLLVEAMTHASFVTGDNQRCLERLEFIGDSVLDYVIVTRLFSADPPLKHDQMHLLKTAMVNGDFLAFISFESGVHREEAVVTDELKVETRVVTTPLWKFMRHASTAIGLEQTMTAKRHQEVREDIRAAMETGTHYPWALLAKLQARKFFSDIVEALLGAVWVDSGSLEVCGGVVERLGILPYLERILRDGVEVQHPKEVLGKFAVAETVRYETEVIVNSEGDREFACNVHVGSRIVTRVEGGVSKEEVKTKAATEAVRILRMEMNAMDLD